MERERESCTIAYTHFLHPLPLLFLHFFLRGHSQAYRVTQLHCALIIKPQKGEVAREAWQLDSS